MNTTKDELREQVHEYFKTHDANLEQDTDFVMRLFDQTLKAREAEIRELAEPLYTRPASNAYVVQAVPLDRLPPTDTKEEHNVHGEEKIR